MSAEKELKGNKTKRKIIRGSVTKLIQKIDDEIMKNENSDSKLIIDLLAVLSKHGKVLEDLDKAIENLINITELEAEVENSLTYKENIVLCRSRVNRYLGNSNKNAMDIQAVSNLNQSNAETTFSDTRVKTNTKLPRISLNKFSGDICQFQEFWPQYAAAIHENESLQKVEKFNYLKTLLSDSAAKAISGLPLTSENYDKAIQILKDRFGKKDILIAAHTNRLLNLEPVRKSYDVPALRKLHDEISVQIRSLESLGINPDSYTCLLLPILYKCIPNDLVLQFHRNENDKEESSVTELLNLLKKETEAREKSLSLTPTGNFENAKSFENKREKQNIPKYFTSVKNKISSACTLNALVEPQCDFCNSNHKSENCTLDLEQRKNSLLKQRKCFKCYKRNHRRVNCVNNRIKCTICSSKSHHMSLCNQPQINQTKNSTPKIEGSSQSVLASLIDSLLSENKKCGTQKENVYFQTLRCKLISKNEIVKIRVCLDSAAARTFIRRDLSSKLDLEVTGQEDLKIITFANNNETGSVKSLRRVRVLLADCKAEHSCSIEALETESICPDIIRVPSSELRDKIKNIGIDLSDVPDDLNMGNKIDMLIGSDYYWTIMTGNMKCLSPTIALNETKFGWILHG